MYTMKRLCRGLAAMYMYVYMYIYVAVPRQDCSAHAVLSGHCNRFVGYL